MNRVLILLARLLGMGCAGKYVGDYKDGKPHGQGTITYPDGAMFVGEFKDGKSHGQGTYTWPDGDKYVGEYKANKMHGRGTFTFSNGDKYSGKWRNDQLFEGTVHTDARNCALRLITNYYLPTEDACHSN